MATHLMDTVSSLISQEVGEPAWSFAEEQVPGENVFTRQRGGSADHRTCAVLSPKPWKNGGSAAGQETHPGPEKDCCCVVCTIANLDG